MHSVVQKSSSSVLRDVCQIPSASIRKAEGEELAAPATNRHRLADLDPFLL